MLDAIRRAVDTSKALCMQDAQLQPLSYKEAFRLATLGGSEGTRVLLSDYINWSGFNLLSALLLNVRNVTPLSTACHRYDFPTLIS